MERERARPLAYHWMNDGPDVWELKVERPERYAAAVARRAEANRPRAGTGGGNGDLDVEMGDA
jgi:hypothetical protein